MGSPSTDLGAHFKFKVSYKGCSDNKQWKFSYKPVGWCALFNASSIWKANVDIYSDHVFELENDMQLTVVLKQPNACK